MPPVVFKADGFPRSFEENAGSGRNVADEEKDFSGRMLSGVGYTVATAGVVVLERRRRLLLDTRGVDVVALLSARFDEDDGFGVGNWRL